MVRIAYQDGQKLFRLNQEHNLLELKVVYPSATMEALNTRLLNSKFFFSNGALNTGNARAEVGVKDVYPFAVDMILLPTLLFAPVFRNRGPYTPIFFGDLESRYIYPGFSGSHVPGDTSSKPIRSQSGKCSQM